MDPSELSKCIEEVNSIIRQAGTMVKEAFYQEKVVTTKTNMSDLVTESDKAVESFIITNLRQLFPSHCFIGEESVEAKNSLSNEPTWIIDPIDGTTNFVHRIPQVCISIGLAVNKQVVYGIVYNPILEEVYSARKGCGAFLNGKPIKSNNVTELSQAVIYGSVSNKEDAKLDPDFKSLRSLAQKIHGFRACGSAAMSLCQLAAGRGECYWEISIHVWDVAAGALILTEAGGAVYDVTGGEFDMMNRRILAACTPELATRVAAHLNPVDYERD